MKWAIATFFVWAAVVGQAQTSPFTRKAVVPPDSAGIYRILIGGHFHGASTNVSGYPASTVLAGLDIINGLRANVLLSTGDLFLNAERDSLRFARSFFSKLDVALFNAPGNHDVEGRTARHWAAMPVRIAMGRDRIVLLDTERDDSDIRNDQLELLRTLADSVEQGAIGKVFIVSHRPIWSEADERYGKLFAGNTRSMTGANYQQEVLPLLRRMAARSPVFWISGSMAGRAPASIFFQPHEKNITYIQCAVREQLRDALLMADVSVHGVQWSAISLTGRPVEKVETYDAAWWSKNQGAGEPPFNWRLLPYLVKKNLAYPSFWYGFALGVGLLLLAVMLLRRRGRKASTR